VAVTLQQGILDSLTDLIGFGLPSSQTDGGDLVTGVEGVCLSVEGKRGWVSNGSRERGLE
jgi:hypothetical protein